MAKQRTIAFAMVLSDCQKGLFDNLADGETVSPPRPPLSSFQPRLSGTAENCKETILLSENGIFLQKNRCGRAVHAAAPDFILYSNEVFDKQRTIAFAMVLFVMEPLIGSFRMGHG